MFKSKAKKLLAVAMIFAVALSLQLPSFAAVVNDMSITLRAPASGTPGKVDIVVDATEFDGIGGNAITGTVVLEMMTGGLGGTYEAVPGATVQNVTVDTDEVIFSDIAIATEDLFYRATFNDTINDTQVELELDPYSFNSYEFTDLNYTINGTNLEISTSTFELGTTGTVDIGKSTDGGTNWVRVGAQTILTGTETVFSVTDTYPTQDTLYRVFYRPSEAELLKGYTEKVTVMPSPYRVGFFKPVTIPGYGKDPSGLTVALNLPTADPAIGMTLNLTSDADRLIHENMELSQSYYSSLPAGYSLFAAVDLRLTSTGIEMDTLATTAALGDAGIGAAVPFIISGLRPGSEVAVVRTSGTIDAQTYTTTTYTVDSEGRINTEDEMIRELTTETGAGTGIYTTDNASTIFIYTNYAPTPTPTPVPVPVSPSTGIYN